MLKIELECLDVCIEDHDVESTKIELLESKISVPSPLLSRYLELTVLRKRKK